MARLAVSFPSAGSCEPEARPPRRSAGAHKIRRSLAALASLLILLPGAEMAAAASGESKPAKAQDGRDRLKEVQRELGRERDKVREATKRESFLSKELTKLEEDLRTKTKLLHQLEGKLQGSSQRIARLGQDIKYTENRLQRSRTLLQRRLRAIYKQGRFGYVRVLLSAEDVSSASRRLKYLSTIASQDRRLMQTYGTSLEELSRKRKELEQYKAEVADSTGKAAQTRNQIVEEQRKRQVLLASVREEKSGHLAAIKELEKSAKDLQALVARLQNEEERQRRAGRTTPRQPSKAESPRAKEKEEAPDIQDDGRFAGLKGRLPWPTAGDLISTFGRQEHPRFRTATFNRGIEIAAKQGRDILAVAEGTAIYADWFKGYGRLVILDHGGGYFTLYAHASEIAVKSGDGVSRGQVIAKVGESGSLAGPQLYFELRHKGKPLDPVAWLAPR